ncbi:MAG: HAMP domain-containing histidine kinase [Candidatus Aminicenantes bacterium]|nr:HAMP domain-containing histidine kinase [Candidatus Aminicenantes bacterium]
MKKALFFLYLFVGLIIFLISIYGFFLLRQRPGLPLPPEVNYDFIEQIDGVRTEGKLDREFMLSRKTIGEQVTFHIKVNNTIEQVDAQIIPYYSGPQASYPLIYFLIALFCLAVAILVFFLRAEDSRARIYYWASLALSSSLIINSGFFCLRKNWLSYVPGILFYIFYPLAPALLLRFSLFFSKKKLKISRFFIYCPALIFAGALEVLFLLSSLKSSIEINKYYQIVLYALRCYLIFFVLLAVFFLIFSYRKVAMEEERAQIKWIFYGLFVGLGPFILLYELPQVIRNKPLMTEEFSLLFFIFIPLAFAFSIVKFKLMEVELVINRSLVYFLLTVFTVSIYLFSVALFQNIFSNFFSVNKTAVSVIGALAAAVAFHPARKKIQEIVDKAFFRMSFDYKKSILSFSERAYEMVNRGQLVEFFLQKIKNTLPLEHIGVYIFSVSSGKPKLLIGKNGDKNLNFLVSLCMDSDNIIARKRAVRTEEHMDFSREEELEEKKIELIFPLSFKSSDFAGLLSLGKKKSGEKFSRDDIELLLTMARELALNLERIRLQEEVIYERVEREKLNELNRLKTEFISSVSHELRTPMSSIQGLAEILQGGKIKEKTKQDELINLVASESSRLSRFLHNILDFGKIEQQVKTYNFQKVEIQSIIKEIAQLFLHKLESDGFVFTVDLAEDPIFLEIDQDAVKQALTNLIDNAIKYSSDKREIVIQLIEREKMVEIHVKDKGIGIPSRDIKRIFEEFYRHAEASQHNPKGVGLGLKIVKHIMEAHKGEVKVESQANKSSTFILIFPKP